jgi:hypothetical protein
MGKIHGKTRKTVGLIYGLIGHFNGPVIHQYIAVYSLLSQLIWDLYNRIHNDIMCITQGNRIYNDYSCFNKVFQQPNMGIQPSTIGISPRKNGCGCALELT